jgi:hypothetical protein
VRLIAVAVFGVFLPLGAHASELAFARTCIKATQTERGRMANVSVEESSGNRHVDAFAKNLVKVFRLELTKGQSVPRQEGYVVVDYFEDGRFASTLFKERVA